MSQIPIVVEPYEDELLYSWIFRLAKTNGLSIDVFSDAYLGTHNAKISSLPYDVRSEFIELCKSIGQTSDMGELFLQLSLFGLESMFMVKSIQSRYVNNIFQPKDALNPPVHTLVTTIKICPDCIREDAQRLGSPYIHRAHQYSGICFCYKHGSRLMVYTGAKGSACNYNLEDYQLVEVVTDLAFARYVKAIADSRVYSDLSKINEIAELNTNDSTELISLLISKYPNANDLIAILRDGSPIIRQFKCDTCNSTYYSTLDGNKNGWKCSACETGVSLQDRFIKLVDATGNGAYDVQGRFISMDVSVPIKHKECSKISPIRPRSFLFEGVRCKCEHIINESEARKAIEAVEGFTLVKFEGARKPITVFHNVCQREFTCNYHKFLQFPGCRKCTPKNMTTELLREQIKNKRNGEYELVGEFIDQNHDISIKHCICGHITNYSPRYFYRGAGCPVCSNTYAKAWNKMYSIYVDYVSENKTNIISKTSIYKGEQLGLWAQKQRDDKRTGVLLQNKIDALNSVGFVWEPLEDEWWRRYEQYKRYIKVNGSPYIARRTGFEGEHLGAWVETQRKWYATGKMPEARVKLMLTLNPDFYRSTANEELEKEWNRKFEQYKRYCAETRQTSVPENTIYEHENLGSWYKVQKRALKKGKLAETRRQFLAGINPEQFGNS